MSHSLTLDINRLIIKDKYDESLSKHLIELITCKICQCVLTDPYDCLCCNQTFCFTCINNSILKNCKCPNNDNYNYDENKFNLINQEVMMEFQKLKPSSENFAKFLTNLKFKCINCNFGCQEEIEYNNIILHEMNCQHKLNNLNHSISLNILPINKSNFTSNDSINEIFHRKFSLVSFACHQLNNYERISNVSDNNTINISTNDKLDKILESMQSIQNSISKNHEIDNIPFKDYNSETPKFNLSFKNTKEKELIYTCHENLNHPVQNLTNKLQQEKIISDLETLNEKINLLEDTLIDTIKRNEIISKKNIEDQFNNLFDKMRDHMQMSQICSTLHSSNCNSVGNLSNIILPKSKSSGKLDFFNFKSKEEKPKEKKKEKLIINKENEKSQFYNNRNINVNKFNKVKKENNLLLINKNNFSNSQDYYNKNQINNIIEDLSNKLIEINNYSLFKNDLEKIVKNLNTNLIEEVKTTFVEVTLDSTNLLIQKFDEVIRSL